LTPLSVTQSVVLTSESTNKQTHQTDVPDDETTSTAEARMFGTDTKQTVATTSTATTTSPSDAESTRNDAVQTYSHQIMTTNSLQTQTDPFTNLKTDSIQTNSAPKTTAGSVQTRTAPSTSGTDQAPAAEITTISVQISSDQSMANGKQSFSTTTWSAKSPDTSTSTTKQPACGGNGVVNSAHGVIYPEHGYVGSIKLILVMLVVLLLGH